MDFPLNANYSFIISIEDHHVQVTYKRTPYSDCYDPELDEKEMMTSLVHYIFQGRAISPTSYKSHFTYTEAINEFGGGCPYTHANEIIKELYQEQKEIYPQLFSKQLSLF